MRVKREGTFLQRGTTLLEIVITMAVMSFGMLGFFTLQIRAMQISKSAILMSQATSIASAVQDSLLAQPYDEASLSSSGSGVSAPLTECTETPADDLADLCYKVADVNRAGNTDTDLGPLSFSVSYDVTNVDTVDTADSSQIRLRVRVRYPAEEGVCPDCASERARGWKAVTFTTVRTATAY